MATEEKLSDKFQSLLAKGKNLPGKILPLVRKDIGNEGAEGSPARSPFRFTHSRTSSSAHEGDSGSPPHPDAVGASSRGPFGSSHRVHDAMPTSTNQGVAPADSSTALAGSASGSIHSSLTPTSSASIPGQGPAGSGGGGGAAWASGVATAAVANSKVRATPQHRVDKFKKLLDAPVVDLDALRELAWNGIPPDLRPVCWRLLLGYLPPAKSRQEATLGRKRREYQEMVPEYYDIANSERSEDELTALRQVQVDVPRTAPAVPFFHEPAVQKSLERLLYIWGIRHPASGYVQGMNDLVTPFLAVFLAESLPGPISGWRADMLTEELLLDVEADCYWCLCKLVEQIQDHYTYAQPGIQRTVFRVKELVSRVNVEVAAHFEEQNVDFIQFAWRWINCLLIREMPFELSFRLWDTYLAEGSRFCDFLVYASAAFLLGWEKQLTSLEFQDLIMFLQKLPTSDWDESHVEAVLSQAWVYRTSFDEAKSHLKAQ